MRPVVSTLLPAPTRDRRSWLAVLLALWICGGTAEARAASVAAARAERAAAQTHRCKCSSDCEGDCCCARREQRLARMAAPAPRADDVPAPSTRRRAGPCVRSVPCGGQGLPSSPSAVPLVTKASLSANAHPVPRDGGRRLDAFHPALHARLAGALPDEPPEPRTPA
ncbi:MAG: hypothetical protein P4L84_03370 [Isosphaeraceae bacterium]|nr:hypothetical protein [Isosphaeraceae bacterium]